jgi:hypothetical protein
MQVAHRSSAIRPVGRQSRSNSVSVIWFHLNAVGLCQSPANRDRTHIQCRSHYSIEREGRAECMRWLTKPRQHRDSLGHLTGQPAILQKRRTGSTNDEQKKNLLPLTTLPPCAEGRSCRPTSRKNSIMNRIDRVDLCSCLVSNGLSTSSAFAEKRAREEQKDSRKICGRRLGK